MNGWSFACLHAILMLAIHAINGNYCNGLMNCSISFVKTQNIRVTCDSSGFYSSASASLLCLNDDRCAAINCQSKPCVPCRGDQITDLVFNSPSSIYFKRRFWRTEFATYFRPLTDETYEIFDGLFPGDMIYCRFTPEDTDRFEIKLKLDDTNILYGFRSGCIGNCSATYNCGPCVYPTVIKFFWFINGENSPNDTQTFNFQLYQTYDFYLLIQETQIKAYYDTSFLKAYPVPLTGSIRKVRYIEAKGTYKLDIFQF